jgi:hypothetical protein
LTSLNILKEYVTLGDFAHMKSVILKKKENEIRFGFESTFSEL